MHFRLVGFAYVAQMSRLLRNKFKAGGKRAIVVNEARPKEDRAGSGSFNRSRGRRY